MSKKYNKMTIDIQGMTCASCEIVIEREFKKINGIKNAKVNHATGKVQVFYSKKPTLTDLQSALSDHHYKIESQSPKKVENKKAVNNGGIKITVTKNHFEVGAIFLIVMAVYLFLRQFDILPDVSVADDMTYGFIFMIGVVAAMSSCLAVTGGLLLTVASKYNESNPGLSGYQKFKPTLYFNIGRVLGYTLLGGLIGWIGSALTFSTTMTGVMTLLASLVMIVLGFQMLNIFPWMKKFQPKMPKFIAHRVHDLSESGKRTTPMVLGAATFFLPCGFTQALQLYVLAQGGAMTGALTMLAFSLGTLPALLSLSTLSSYMKGSFQKYFMKTAGVVVVLLGLANVGNGFALVGSNLTLPDFSSSNKGSSVAQAQVQDPNVRIENGIQIVDMTVTKYDYFPHKFTIKKGVPVEWRIDAKAAAGCGRVLVSPKIGINQYLSSSKIDIIKFTPKSKGSIPFNCSMGMMTSGSGFNVVE